MTLEQALKEYEAYCDRKCIPKNTRDEGAAILRRGFEIAQNKELAIAFLKSAGLCHENGPKNN